MKTHTVRYHCTQSSFEAKLPILMGASNHRNVLIWFYNPEMSPFYLAYAIWVSVILELREIISDAGLVNRWLRLLTAGQNDIQNRDNRKQEVLLRPLTSTGFCSHCRSGPPGWELHSDHNREILLRRQVLWLLAMENIYGRTNDSHCTSRRFTARCVYNAPKGAKVDGPVRLKSFCSMKIKEQICTHNASPASPTWVLYSNYLLLSIQNNHSSQSNACNAISNWSETNITSQDFILLTLRPTESVMPLWLYILGTYKFCVFITFV